MGQEFPMRAVIKATRPEFYWWFSFWISRKLWEGSFFSTNNSYITERSCNMKNIWCITSELFLVSLHFKCKYDWAKRRKLCIRQAVMKRYSKPEWGYFIIQGKRLTCSKRASYLGNTSCCDSPKLMKIQSISDVWFK